MQIVFGLLAGTYIALSSFVMGDYVYNMLHPKPRIVIKVERPVYGMPPMQYFWMDQNDRNKITDYDI